MSRDGIQRLINDTVLTTIILHKRHTIPVLPIIEPLSRKPDLYLEAHHTLHRCPEWFHASNSNHTTSALGWPAWDVLLHLWNTSNLAVAYHCGILCQPRGLPTVLHVYSAANCLPRHMQDEISHRPAEVIVLDSATRHMLMALVHVRCHL